MSMVAKRVMKHLEENKNIKVFIMRIGYADDCTGWLLQTQKMIYRSQIKKKENHGYSNIFSKAREKMMSSLKCY